MREKRSGAWSRLLLAMAAIFAVSALASTAISAAVTAATPPDKVVIKKFQKKKPAVPFPHKQHVDAKMACKDCHHKSEKGKEAACTSCHKAEVEGETPDAKKAFHGTCTKCHKKKAAEGVKSGPTKCNECHTG